MKRWARPYAVEDNLLADQNVAESNCYRIRCEVGYKTRKTYPDSWTVKETEGVTHDTVDGTCGDANANRIITNNGIAESLGEQNKDQGWINAYIDRIYPDENKVGVGSTVYWHTKNSAGTVWNHWGVIENTDPNHPNHS